MLLSAQRRAGQPRGLPVRGSRTRARHPAGASAEPVEVHWPAQVPYRATTTCLLLRGGPSPSVLEIERASEYQLPLNQPVLGSSPRGLTKIEFKFRTAVPLRSGRFVWLTPICGKPLQFLPARSLAGSAASTSF